MSARITDPDLIPAVEPSEAMRIALKQFGRDIEETSKAIFGPGRPVPDVLSVIVAEAEAGRFEGLIIRVGA